ncbi:N-6 DNA methylase [Streptomyces sp. DG2A-72]|uniref:Eco57I restriction-modification methylase domain-containing protein n=1 Tax=Streptomyces sp. DG2A-72 TaxID=3051386 RepID=UPI00265BDAC7|nr:N-6 DNA methylase [Streptomyces sp. DG2A-72]MDO0932020.1 N-6 DNA methylase [Streptomyces sp. DG2A-72]
MTVFTPELPATVSASSAVRVEGRLLTADLLGRLAAGDRELPGCAPADYGLYRGERIGDAAGRAWAALTGAYRVFRDDLARPPETSTATTLTRKAWLLRLFTELGYGRLSGAGVTVKIPGRDETCRASHRWQDHLPVHLLAWGTPLDGRVGNRRAPQSVLQELLNVSGEHVWGLLSNGQVLRVLRDSTALVGSAYVEFDLEAIFDGQQYSDFVLLYSLLHASRFELVAKPEKKRRGRRAQTPQAAGAAPDSESEYAEEGQPEGGDQPAQAELGDEDTVPDSDAPALTAADCRIEWLRTYAIETGLRARDNLRDQVAEAIGVLGTGFLAANPELHSAVSGRGRRGLEALEELHHELLRLAYQLVFLFVAEDRGILLDRSDSPETQDARDRYARYFSTRRLRRIAFRRPGDRNTDLWRALAMVLDALGTDGGAPQLALPELGGLYFRAKEDSAAATLLGRAEPLRAAELPNEHLLEAVRLLARVRDEGGRWQRVDYRHLGADELGSVYESLLELRPRRDPATGRFRLQTLAGNKRKTTGAYYTPTVLIEKLLDQALDPVIERHAVSGNPRELLKINLVDPACGSGHVLVAAARRIALRYAELDTREPEPAPEKVRAAMADVVRHCVHGVDINPMAVELAKVSLWLESLEPGQPLAYLDDRIKVGNALLGTTPKLIAEGIPDGAFKKLAGDNSKILTALKAANKKERSGGKGTQTAMGAALARTGTAELRLEAEALAKLPDRTLANVRDHARAYEEYLAKSPHLRRLKRVADAWCAAFLWPKSEKAPAAVTSSVLEQLVDGGDLAEAVVVTAEEEDDERRLSGEKQLDEIVSRNRFFHWHLEFPRVFRVEDDEDDDHNPDTGWQGGFDCVLGNPPWERVKIQEKEWFAARGEDEIADASNASERKKLIAGLKGSAERGERELFEGFQVALREAAGTTLMLRNSGIFPLTGQGDVNTYAVFAEKARMLLAPEGMSGLVLPTGIATDKTTSDFFADLVDRRQLVTVLDMENEEKLFPDVHHSYRFCLFTVSGPRQCQELVRLAFRARRPDQLDSRSFTLNRAGFRRINPNTRTAPVCESPDHLRVLEDMHKSAPVLWLRGVTEGNPWALRLVRMFHMADDSKLFRSADVLAEEGWEANGQVFFRDGRRALPLYEAKLIHQLDARFSTYAGATEADLKRNTLPRLTAQQHADPLVTPQPRHWVEEEHVDDWMKAEPGKPETEWPHDWMLGWRDICRAVDERTVISTVLPRTAAGNTMPLILPTRPDRPLHGLLANLSTFVLDFAARQKMQGVHLTYTYLEQLPILSPDTYAHPVAWLGGRAPELWIRDRVLELTYTSYEMAPFARHLGDENPPFVWNEDRRFEIRAELDAAYFHLYGIPDADIELVLDSFRAFRNKSPELFERTKDRILTIYREMEKAAESGGSYTNLAMTPPPGKGPRHASGRSPLTRPERTTPEPPQPPEPIGARPPSDEPDAGGGLFSVTELGVDEQLGFWS